MSTDEKKKLAQTLLKEVEEEEKPSKAVESNDFDNPFNLSPPTYMGKVNYLFEIYMFTKHFFRVNQGYRVGEKIVRLKLKGSI